MPLKQDHMLKNTSENTMRDSIEIWFPLKNSNL
jgi:hypothetical protein